MSDNATVASLAGQYLTFTVCGEVFGMNVRFIREILEYGRLTRVPMVPDTIRGVTNLRGNVLPVIDLGIRLERGRSQPGQHTSVVVVGVPTDEGRENVFGVLVDRVHEVLELSEEEVRPPPPFGGGISTEFIAAMGRRGNVHVLMLDAERVLAVDELARFGTRPAERRTLLSAAVTQATVA